MVERCDSELLYPINGETVALQDWTVKVDSSFSVGLWVHTHSLVDTAYEDLCGSIEHSIN